MPPPSAVVLAHVTSIPGDPAIGELDQMSTAFLDLCREGGLDGWQMLPVGPCGAGNSPYSALSSFAGNPLLLAPGPLLADGLLQRGDLPPGPPSTDRVDFAAVTDWKRAWVGRAWDRFHSSPPAAIAAAHSDWLDGPVRKWLDDWCLFAALRGEHESRAWFEWPQPLRHREAAALRAARSRLGEAIRFHAFVQFLFERQWRGLRAAADARGICLIGDLPFYPAHDSAETWSRPELFAMDRDGCILRSAGVPPDYYSEDGQLWGTPVFDWERMEQDDYAWWRGRLECQLTRFDRVRLDHFRGYSAFWAVDGAPRSAREGRWLPGPGAALFAGLPAAERLIAEDLGEIDEPVHELRRELGLPGTAVFHFLQDDGETPLPALPRKTALYTATHDNDTTRGWLESLDADARNGLLQRLGTSEEAAVERIVDLCMQADVETVVIPLQDWLELPGSARMNHPGVPTGNWEWRCSPGPSPGDVDRMRRIVAAANRGRPSEETGPV